jgi:hypothetical protein
MCLIFIGDIAITNSDTLFQSLATALTSPSTIMLVHVGPDKSMNSCDAIRRIVDCTLEQIVSRYQRVVYAVMY